MIRMDFVPPECEPVPTSVREISEKIIARAEKWSTTIVHPGETDEVRQTLTESGISDRFEDLEVYLNQASDLTPTILGTSSAFHTDGYNRYSNDGDRVVSSRTLNLFSSSTPTEYTIGTLIFHNIDIEEMPDRAAAEQAAIASLQPLGGCWIDSASGLDDSSGLSKILELKGIEVKDLSIVQVLPWMIASGRAGNLLHRSARRHESQPRTKLITRWFS